MPPSVKFETTSSKGKVVTRSIHLSFTKKSEVNQVLRELHKKSWREPAYPIPFIKDSKGVHNIHLFKEGKDNFSGWTKKEEREFTKEAREILSNYGFNKVSTHQVAFAKLI